MLPPCPKPAFIFISGNGGNSGPLTVLITRVEGKLELRSCGGTGARPGTNGIGGQGIKY